MLEIRNVCKHFPNRNFSLQQIHCTFPRGLYVLAGPNGSGKSTLLRIAAGILQPDSGTVSFAKQDIYENPLHYKRKLGYLPQTFSFYAHMTVSDFLLYLANLKGLFGKQAALRSCYVLELLDISMYRKAKISALSAGLQQRVSFAQTLLNDPAVLILDEPFCSLAFEESVNLQNLLHRLAQTKTILISSHRINRLPLNRLLLLVNGRLQFDDAPERFLAAANGQVWSAPIARELAPTLLASYPNSTLRNTAENCQLRIISAVKPSLPNVERSLPTLEESYLIWLERLARNEAI